MNRYLCDTTCLVATVSSWHEHHDRTRAEIDRRVNRGEELVLVTEDGAEVLTDALPRDPNALEALVP